jgi:hypothetical protein
MILLAAHDATERVAMWSFGGLILATILGTTIPSIIGAKRGKETSEALGTPNGKGNVVQMVTKILDVVVSLEHRVSRVEQTQTETTKDIARLDGRLSPPTPPLPPPPAVP